jgi:inosine-uridine nucleoside N-ribohydrolase
VCLGPATALAGALQRDRTIADQIRRLVLLGGAWHEPGNVTAASEFHFYCDPEAARAVLHSGLRITLVPLDIMRKLVFSPTDLLQLPVPDSPTAQFLRKIIPFGIRATANAYGIEGMHLKDVMGIVAVSAPAALSTKRYYVNVETRGELTRGMSIVDSRPKPASPPNVDLAVGVDLTLVREYIYKTLKNADQGF